MISYSVQAFLVFVCVFVWTVIVTSCFWAWRRRLITQHVPLFLPLVSFLFTAATIGLVLAWRYSVPHAESLSLTSNSWFAAGWNNGLSFFGIHINTWWGYAIIVNYQVTRTIIGSMLSNVFRPFITSQVQNRLLNKTIDDRLTSSILFAQGAVTVFGFVTTLTDLFLYLSQVDLALISLFVTLISDAASTYGVLQASKGAPVDTVRDKLLENLESLEKAAKPLALRVEQPTAKDFDV